jgi:hypothetical protein
MRIGFTLTQLLGAVLFTCIALGWWTSLHRNARFREHQKHLLLEWAHPLDIVEKRQIYYRALPQRNAGHNRWKVHLPAGRRYALSCVTAPLRGSGPDAKESVLASIPLAPGESMVEVDWRMDTKRKPHLRMAVLGSTDSRSVSKQVNFPPEFSTEFATAHGRSEFHGGWEATLEASPGIRLDLTVVATLFGKLMPKLGDPRTEVGGFNVRIQAVDDPPPALTDPARNL